MNEKELLIRLALALVCGGVIGLEREIKGHSAGLRTITLVCLGSALIVMTDIYVHKAFQTQDSFRMAAQVVTGVGFIGAGTIIQTKASVKGLTTAATIWIAAGIGLALGAGFLLAGSVATSLALLLLILEPLTKHIPSIKQRKRQSQEKPNGM